MSLAFFLELAVAGVAVGAAGTLIGAGGGFLLVPALVLLSPNESPAVLTGISLAVVFANALSGSIAYARMRRIDVRSGLIFAAAGLPGSIAGAFVSHLLDRRTFDPLLGAVLIVGGAIVLFRRPAAEPVSDRPTRRLVETDGTVHQYRPRVVLGAWISVGVGFVSSLIGIGGGIIHVPAMALLLDFPIHVATATSHFVLAMLAFSAVLVHAGTGSLEQGLDRTVPLAVGVLIGAPIGAWLSRRIHGRWILVALALAVISVGIRLLIQRH